MNFNSRIYPTLIEQDISIALLLNEFVYKSNTSANSFKIFI